MKYPLFTVFTRMLTLQLEKMAKPIITERLSPFSVKRIHKNITEKTEKNEKKRKSIVENTLGDAQDHYHGIIKEKQCESCDLVTNTLIKIIESHKSN